MKPRAGDIVELTNRPYVRVTDVAELDDLCVGTFGGDSDSFVFAEWEIVYNYSKALRDINERRR